MLGVEDSGGGGGGGDINIHNSPVSCSALDMLRPGRLDDGKGHSSQVWIMLQIIYYSEIICTTTTTSVRKAGTHDHDELSWRKLF